MGQFTGTAGADTIAGTEGDDVISGLGGYDQIDGKGGNDTIDGGADGDFVEGGAGDDLVDGGDGADYVSDFGGGSDTLRGGAGADSISVSHYNASGPAEALVIDAGDGDDQVNFNSAARGTASIALGDGADRLSLGTVASAALTVATGAGRDTVLLQQYANLGAAAVFSDFTAGDAGDAFDFSEFFARNAVGWDGSNPFGASGHMRLVQSGAAASLQFDRDGAAGNAYAPVTLARFDNTDAGAFTAANFAGYSPDGAAVRGATLIGGAGYDVLTGTVGGDRISGLGGFDQIDGRNGDDTIDGGADPDNIQGGFGDDLIDGGDGDDYLTDIGGSDTLRGGAGADSIFVSHSPNGSNAASEFIRVEGGAGDDRVSYYVFTPGAGVIDLGDGNDRLQLGNGPGAVRATLGAGRDRVELSSFAALNAIPVVTDFTGGADGDNIEITSNFTFGFQNWDGSNPFGASGYLRLVQAGADVLFQVDRDGAAGRNSGFATLARFENMDAARLTADNFSGYTPTVVNATDLATAFVTVPAAVTEGVDRAFAPVVTLKNVANANTTITMVFLADQSTATNGADVNIGSFSGTYYISQSPAGDHRINLGSIAVLDDDLPEPDETIAIRITATGQTFETGTDSIMVRVKLRSDEVAPTEGADSLTGTGGDDILRGLGGNDTLTGLDGRDTLDGGAGVDRLAGGLGDDRYLVDDARDLVVENAGEGYDTVEAGATFALGANVEAMVLTGAGAIDGTGNALANVLTGNGAANALSGAGGNDTLFGAAGDDRLDGGAGDDLLDGGEGADTADYSQSTGAVKVSLELAGAQKTGGAGTDRLLGVENLAGGEGADTLAGDAGANRLWGGGGADSLSGKAGDDVLYGGAGADALDGGAGRDLFVFAELGDSNAADGADRIYGFVGGEDRIDLSAIDAVAGTAADEAFAFIGRAAFGGVAGQLRFSTSSYGTIVQADVDGDRVADFEFTVVGKFVPGEADFLL